MNWFQDYRIDIIESSELIETIAAELSLPESWVSFLVFNSTIYYARARRDSPFVPSTSVTRLIQGIYHLQPTIARKLLRQRIYSTQPVLTPMCYGMTKVAAKRISTQITPQIHFPLSGYHILEVNPQEQSGYIDPNLLHPNLSTLKTHLDFLKFLEQLTKTIPQQSQRYLNNRPVAAMMIERTPEGSAKNILEVAVNTNAINKTLHAEVNLIQNFYERTGQPLPPYTTFYTSLKPCRMCATLIWQCTSDLSSLQVIYAEDDPGTHAQNTILSPNTDDRKRFCSDPEMLTLSLQTQII